MERVGKHEVTFITYSGIASRENEVSRKIETRTIYRDRDGEHFINWMDGKKQVERDGFSLPAHYVCRIVVQPVAMTTGRDLINRLMGRGG